MVSTTVMMRTRQRACGFGPWNGLASFGTRAPRHPLELGPHRGVAQSDLPATFLSFPPLISLPRFPPLAIKTGAGGGGGSWTPLSFKRYLTLLPPPLALTVETCRFHF